MGILLAIDRARDRPGIWALLWTTLDNDPRLLESRHFVGEAALQTWLAGVAARFGPSSITVDWTPALTADIRLAAAVRECVGPSAIR
jgi:hypothetical protein